MGSPAGGTSPHRLRPLRPLLRPLLRSGSGKGLLAAMRGGGAAMMLLLLLLGALDGVIAGTYLSGCPMMMMMAAVLLVWGLLGGVIKERFTLEIGAARHGSLVALAGWTGRGTARLLGRAGR